MPGLIRGVARTAVVAGTATAVSNRVSRRQAGRWAAQSEQQQAAQPAQAAPRDPMDVRIAQLNQLATLRDQGVLSPAEFERQKANILAG